MEKGPQEYFQKSSRENVGTSKSYATGILHILLAFNR